jgi:nucleotidyltransferase/DNA polymerase involved in DNA repair
VASFCNNNENDDGDSSTKHTESRRQGKRPVRREPAVEKAGMDEWYVDVTDVVDTLMARGGVAAHRGGALPPRSGASGLVVGGECAFGDDDGVASAGAGAEGACGGGGGGASAATTGAGSADILSTHARFDGVAVGSFSGVVFGSPPPSGDGDASRLCVASHVCDEIRRRVRERVGLTTSAGVSTCKLFAKMVASKHKPGGQTVFVPTAANVALLLPPDLPVRAVHGIGYATAARLAEAGVTTIGELRAMTRWPAAVTSSAGSSLPPLEQIKALTSGVCHSEVVRSQPPKSVTAEDSYHGETASLCVLPRRCVLCLHLLICANTFPFVSSTALSAITPCTRVGAHCDLSLVSM